ncbi:MULTISPECIES: DNA polymerase III subunit gamma/tau [Rhodomicrobium]|uniref:DNA polymerase III subunit gamma/tau n=2 Tax=Rhodomicrobium TaxID=1068 RepID=UPI0024781156|nr:MULTISPECIES: DNA polymerase III subunit gamma/tau [Rhodomicrobium]
MHPAPPAGSFGARARPWAATQIQPARPMTADTKPYLVLARKYRPQTFQDLIGQDAMVRTLKNAFHSGRIAQGYMLTGVRGVGKTTTARIIARALNYSKPGQDLGPTIDMPDFGEHCQAIIESRHVDVVEMDAASHTGIDDIREIIESVRYKPAYARYKVFIIDEVHMLSKAAFNGLLKTLEEPPPHVKFIFATTEIRKVPVTVLSRCQRFDLRRIDAALLTEHFGKLVKAEGQSAEPEALALIARAAEGSARDGLSILDQALAHGEGTVKAADVLAMLGLADRGRVYDLLDAVLGGDPKTAIAQLAALHNDGADPIQIVGDLAEAVHAATRIKAAGEESVATLSAAERARAKLVAGRLSMGALSRAWQMLLKGLDEVARAPRGMTAAEMLLIRMCYAADLPSPDELIRSLTGRTQAQTKGEPSGNESAVRGHVPDSSDAMSSVPPGRRAMGGESGAVSEARMPEQAAAPAPALPALQSFADVVALANEKRDVKLKIALEDAVEIVRFKPGQIELHLLDAAPKELANELARKLKHWTGERWMISVTDERGSTPLGVLRRAREAKLLEDARRHPAVQSVLRHFPEAEITAVRELGPGDMPPKKH